MKEALRPGDEKAPFVPLCSQRFSCSVPNRKSDRSNNPKQDGQARHNPDTYTPPTGGMRRVLLEAACDGAVYREIEWGVVSGFLRS